MFQMIEDLRRLAPELVLCSAGALLMLLEPFLPLRSRRRTSTVLAVIGAVSALVAIIYPFKNAGIAFGGLLAIDGVSVFFHLLVGVVALLVILASSEYLARENLGAGEFYALVFFATAGMGVMASAQELMIAFIGLEMSSISSYILASYRRRALKSNEAAMKYFLLGSFATAFLLYGIAMVYGATGTTFLPNMNTGPQNLMLLRLGFAMIFIGLAFKVAAAPFQIWTPDVYEGAPTPVTALFSAGPKAVAFALLLRIFATVTTAHQFWFWALWISAVLTMFVGNLGALVQTNIKRMLAYSSIAHAGYVLVAFAASNQIGLAAVLYYLLAYALMKVGAFTVVSHLGGEGERHIDINDYAGLGQRQPATAAVLTLYLLSLLGMPITAGFLGKFYIFKAALDSRLIFLAILMAVNSVIGAYYYLRVIVVMYMREPQEGAVAGQVPLMVGLVLVITAAGTIYLGLFPNQIMDFVSQTGLLQR